MAEDAFERFRRLRGLAQLVSVQEQVEETETEAPLSPLSLLQQLHALGVRLKPWPDGTVHYRVPQSTLTPDLLDAIGLYKDELHALLEAFEERAGILEYGAGLSRREAEAIAWQGVGGA